MSANVALSDTFNTWRTRTNVLLTYTQNDGGSESLKLANTTDSSNTTTGSIQTTGGMAIAKALTVGGNVAITGNASITGDGTISGNTVIGSNNSDKVTINAKLASSIIPLTDATPVLGSTTLRYGSVFVNGVVGSNTVGSLQIPSGTTAQRVGETGSIRYNTTLSRFEGNTGSAFVSLVPTPQDADGDTKITTEGSADEDFIRFFTGNSSTASTERVNISIGGNVAIGTGATAGDAKLQVSGTANISGTTTFGGVTNFSGNVLMTPASGGFVNVQTTGATSFITLKTPLTTIDSNNTIITGNLVVQGTRTFVDTTTLTSRDKTIVLGAGSATFVNASFTAANPTVVTSPSAHGLSSTDKIVVLRTSDATNLPAEAIYTVTVTNSTTFTIPVDMSAHSAGTIDFAGPQTDAGVDDAGIIIPGTTVHKMTWDDADDSFNFTDPVDITGNLTASGDVKLGNNRILASDGGVAITTDTSDNVTVGGNLKVTGNEIQASDGGTTISFDTSDNVTIGGDLRINGNDIQNSDGEATITMDANRKVTVANNLVVTANVTIADGGTIGSASDTDALAISSGGDITIINKLIYNASNTSGNTILVSNSTGGLVHSAFGIFNSSGTRVGP